MASRLDLHEELCILLGSRNVYFNPPESVKLVYPCIVYSKAGVNKVNANNHSYKSIKRYTVTTIDSNPDSDLAERIMEHFSMCSFDRAYPSNNLNHNVLTLYY